MPVSVRRKTKKSKRSSSKRSSSKRSSSKRSSSKRSSSKRSSSKRSKKMYGGQEYVEVGNKDLKFQDIPYFVKDYKMVGQLVDQTLNPTQNFFAEQGKSPVPYDSHEPVYRLNLE
jgi:hypothetical protein